MSLMRDFDPSLIQQMRDAFDTKKELDNSVKGVEIRHEPFTHCIISDLIKDDEFKSNLRKEIKSKLKYAQKSNDLYKFKQTEDLAKSKWPHISKLRDELLYGSLLTTLKQVTGIELSSSKIDVTSSKYEHTDYLLCHDDDIHDDVNKFGRRIAFIYYLVPEDWQETDGGNLDLFSVNANCQPSNVCKSLCPKLNRFLFFEVSDRSFHQVSEVLSETKSRLSINGWFHGQINNRPSSVAELPPQLQPYNKLDSEQFFDWLSHKYINPAIQAQIKVKFADSCETRLNKAFNSKKFHEVSDSLASPEIIWLSKGPRNKRNYEIADMLSAPKPLLDLVQVLTSHFMGITLSNITGLNLHSSCKRNDDDEDDIELEGEYEKSTDDEEKDDQETDDGDEEEDEENEEEEEEEETESDDEESESEEEAKETATNGDSQKRKRNSSDEEETDEATTKNSAESSENIYKKFKSRQSNSNNSAACSSNSSSSLADEMLEGDVKPRCHVEVRRWRHGFYTLVTDDNNELRSKALDLMLHFQCKAWHIECGGNVSYIARDEDSELLTVNPAENTISLVYRDEETLKFTKYVNSKIKRMNKDKEAVPAFYEIAVVYYE